MKERPIIFSGEMVRAILDGRKTQTRRVVKPQPESNDQITFWHWDEAKNPDWAGLWYSKQGQHTREGRHIHCPCGKLGERLWVRETFVALPTDLLKECDIVTGRGYSVAYRANGEPPKAIWPNLKWKPSIFMPRWASRITLEIVNVRVERLQEISEGDAVAEGTAVVYMQTHKTTFHQLWDAINGKRAPWSSNPLVWVIEFKVLQPLRNMDGDPDPLSIASTDLR